MTLTKKKRVIIIATGAVVVIAFAIGALFFRGGDKNGPGKIEQNAVKVEVEPGEEEEKMEQPDGGGAVGMLYSESVLISLSTREAMLNFTNPDKSNQDIVLQIRVDGNVIAESGRLQPGYQVTTLSEIDTSHLSEGVYQGDFTLGYYESGNMEAAVVTTDIPIEITVEA